jgi:hypothetical protein
VLRAITEKIVVVVPEHVSYDIIDEEAVILNVQTGKFFGLNETGTRMWELLAQHSNISLVANILLEEYDIAEDRLWEDLMDLIEKLQSRGLIELEKG